LNHFTVPVGIMASFACTNSIAAHDYRAIAHPKSALLWESTPHGARQRQGQARIPANLCGSRNGFNRPDVLNNKA
jgi:hypothetical protein